MKKLFYNIGVLAIASSLVLSACKKELEVQPTQSIDATIALDNAEGVESAVTGAYSLLGSGSAYGTNFNLVSELMGGDSYCNWSGTFASYRQIRNKVMQINNAEAQRSWLNSYRTINIANNVLANISKVTDEDAKAELEGQAYFIRGILHFELVRLYGKPYEAGTANAQLGVPIMLKAVSTSQDAYTFSKRNTVAEVYAQVISDLKKAEQLLPTAAVKFRAAKYTATAFLSRVYLQMQDYPNALATSNDVIKNSGKALNASVTAVYSNKNTNETLFEIQANDQNNAGTSNDGLTTFYSGQTNFIGRGDAHINATFSASFEPSDQRRVQLMYVGRRSRTHSAKWLTYGQNIPVIRLAEMYLTRAECNTRLVSAVGDTPLNDINKIRQRAGASLFLVVPTVDQILTERAFELCYEGSRIHDLKRTKRSTGTFAYNSDKLVFPIPEREVRANPELLQNDGY